MLSSDALEKQLRFNYLLTCGLPKLLELLVNGYWYRLYTTLDASSDSFSKILGRSKWFTIWYMFLLSSSLLFVWALFCLIMNYSKFSSFLLYLFDITIFLQGSFCSMVCCFFITSNMFFCYIYPNFMIWRHYSAFSCDSSVTFFNF